MPAKNGIIHLLDLPEDKVCVKLPDKLQKKMIKTAITIAGGRCKLAYKIGVKPVNIYDFEKSRFKSITFSVVNKLSAFLVANNYDEFSLKNLERKLEYIKSKFTGNFIFMPKFPMNFNCREGAQIISAILFDGGITSRYFPIYTNNEECLVNKFIRNIQNVIGKIEFTRYTKRKCGNLFRVTLSTVIGYILSSGLEISVGDKTSNNPSIPEFIINNPNLYKSFLQQAFDDEGTVSKKVSKAISLSQSNLRKEPPKRLIQLKEMIERFNIPVNGPYLLKKYESSNGDYISYHWHIQITNQSDIKNFAQKINFSLKRQRTKIEEALASYISKPQFKKGTKFKKILEICKDLKKENKKVTVKNVADKLKRKEFYIKMLMRGYVTDYEQD